MDKYSGSSNTQTVYIGYPEKPQKNDLDLSNFPSKLGGKPLWLFPFKETTDFNFRCDICKDSLTFLCQLYSPLEGVKQAYHRYIYIFFCQVCWTIQNSVKALRLQLPKESEYIKDETILFNPSDLAMNEISNSLKFFKKEHLISTYEEEDKVTRYYLKDTEIVDEDDLDEDEDESDKSGIDNEVKDPKFQKMLKDYYKEESESPFKEVEKVESDELDKFANKVFNREPEDKVFTKFKKVISYDQDQVIRYSRGVEPLWFRNIGKLDLSKNNKCSLCKSNMIFEFQIMPAIFSMYKEILDVDIGTIIVFTCKNSCETKVFNEEFAYIQRTGEKPFKSKKSSGDKQSNVTTGPVKTAQEEFMEYMNKNLVTEKDLKDDDSFDEEDGVKKDAKQTDEEDDGWVEVKSKGKKTFK